MAIAQAEAGAVRWLEGTRLALEPYPWAYTLLVLSLLLLAAALANLLTRKVLLRGLRRVVGRLVRRGEGEDSYRLKVIPRLANVVPALVISAGIGWVPGMPPAVVAFVHGACQAWVVLTLALAFSHALDALNDLYERRPDARHKPIKGYVQVAKIAVFILAGLSIIATLAGVRMLHLVTGLGAATAVVMLVFQDTILSFVASVQISSDGRVRVGDWIEMPSQNADGDVTDIALHTVTVQNWDKTVTTIPTRKLISESFKNWRGMTESGGRRIKRALHLDQASVRFLEPAERDALRRFSLLRDYLDAKERELADWNAGLGADGELPVNARRITNLGTFRAYVTAYLEDPDWYDRTYHWLHDAMGGAATLASYGVPGAMWTQPSATRDAFAEAFPETHLEFLHACRRHVRIGGYLFVHAGIRPGVPLEHQDPEDLIWIREPFLGARVDFGFKVVHGHTIVPAVEHHPNRIAIDTGAVRSDRLSCLLLDGAEVALLEREGLQSLPEGAGLADSRGWRNLWIRR